MRKIKFRMWNPISGKYHYDVENVFNCIAQQNVYNSTMDTRGFTPPYDFIGEGYVFEQFTGLTDKNGLEIYENDEVIFYTYSGYKTSKVEWDERGMWLPFLDDEYIQDEQGDWIDYSRGFEVIGNIHQNK